ncbi:MAG: hypothetical protein M1G31_27930 [Pseudanabaena sp. Salubria-1]|nr:hypothetical protein [Pseudanabaena sp. Salubria-1]
MIANIKINPDHPLSHTFRISQYGSRNNKMDTLTGMDDPKLSLILLFFFENSPAELGIRSTRSSGCRAFVQLL